MLLPIILFVLFNPPPEQEVPISQMQGGDVFIPSDNSTNITDDPIVVPAPLPTAVPIVVKGEDPLPSPLPKEPIVPMKSGTDPSEVVSSSRSPIRTPEARENLTKTQEELIAEHVHPAPISSGSLVNPPATAYHIPLVADPQPNCLSHRAAEKGSGIYQVNPDEGEPFFVFCDMETEGGGWTVLQRRIDGSEDFHNKYYDAYDLGFGKLTGNLWLGLNYMHRLAPSTETPQVLRIELHGDQCTAASCSKQPQGMWWGEWEFNLSPKDKGYALHVSNASLAGNMTDPDAKLRWETMSSGMKFTTLDSDNDHDNSINCAQFRNLGGWWHRDCTALSLNGKYEDKEGSQRHMHFLRDGDLGAGYFVKPKKTLMMIRPQP